MTALSDTSTKSVFIYSERLPGSRFFCKLANCAAAHEERWKSQEANGASAKGPAGSTHKQKKRRLSKDAEDTAASGKGPAPRRRRCDSASSAGDR